MGQLYLFFKWLHIAAVISWMCGVLYLYRILIYERERGSEPAVHDVLCMMGRKLYRIITVPALTVTYIAGFSMIAISPELARGGWFHVKFLCVILLTIATIYANRLLLRFEQKANNVPTSKRLRLLNEVPTILMLIIIGMVVFKPF